MNMEIFRKKNPGSFDCNHFTLSFLILNMVSVPDWRKWIHLGYPSLSRMFSSEKDGFDGFMGGGGGYIVDLQWCAKLHLLHH